VRHADGGFGAETHVTGVAAPILVRMSAEPTGITGRSERPVERTDPMLPVIVDGMERPADLPPPRVPDLDDDSVAAMIAELDGPDPVPSPRPGAVAVPSRPVPSRPVPSRSVPSRSVPHPAARDLDDDGADDARPDGGEDAGHDTDAGHDEGQGHDEGLDADLDAREGQDADLDADQDVDEGTPAVVPAEVVGAYPLPAESSARWSPAPPDPIAVDRYVRRDYRPGPQPADALSLTGLSRHLRGKAGSRLFTVLFVAVFLLITIQAVVSLLTAA
jgi:hypothetical protein